ncbi:FecR family protein [Pseudoalteromonas sp. 68 DY56-GL68]|uniref:FecR family protein n=1 Tax=Pseudoalteromonas sp. 68 DY56-GL68 TaxID=2974919 RepID=UPI00352B8AD2
MSNVHPFSSKDMIQAQASRWVSAIDRGLSDKEVHELQQWAKQSNAHQDALFELAQLWDEMSVLNELSSLFPEKTQHKQPAVFGLATATSFLVVMLLGCVLLIYSSYWQSAEDDHAKFTKIYRTKVGEQATYVLPDSTIVQLNTNTKLEVVYTGDRRQLILNRGEGRFNVAKDASRPFTVIAGDKSFTALGTVFNVQRNTSSDLELVVTEGKVMIAEPHTLVDANDFEHLKDASNESLSIKKLHANVVVSGEKALIKHSKTEPVKQLSMDDVQRDLAWQHGMIIFNGEPLGEALQEVSRYTATRFELTDPDLTSLKVAGVFKAGDIKGLLESLHANLAVKHQRLGEHRVSLSFESKS